VFTLAVPFLLIYAIVAGVHRHGVTFNLFLAVAIIVSVGHTSVAMGWRFDEIKKLVEKMQEKQKDKE
jgi:hypothetical protein